MLTKWTKKEILRFVLCFAIFFGLVLCTQLPGFASPLYWVLFPIFAAFVAAGPITCVMQMKPGFGAAAAIPLLWLILYRCFGELSIPMMWIWMLAVIVAAEIVWACVGHEKRSGLRLAVPIVCLVPLGNLMPLYFSKADFLSRASEEMSSAYVNGLDHYGTIPMFVLVLVLCLVSASVAERITEKILKIDM